MPLPNALQTLIPGGIISAIGIGNPSQLVTLTKGHAFKVGDTVTFTGTDSTPAITTGTVTVVTDTTATVNTGVNVTVAGTTGAMAKTLGASTNTRRLRAQDSIGIHLVLNILALAAGKIAHMDLYGVDQLSGNTYLIKQGANIAGTGATLTKAQQYVRGMGGANFVVNEPLALPYEYFFQLVSDDAAFAGSLSAELIY